MGRGTAHNLRTVQHLQVREDWRGRSWWRCGRSWWQCGRSWWRCGCSWRPCGCCLRGDLWLFPSPGWAWVQGHSWMGSPPRSSHPPSSRVLLPEGLGKELCVQRAERLGWWQPLLSPGSSITSSTAAPARFKYLFSWPNADFDSIFTINYLLNTWPHMFKSNTNWRYSNKIIKAVHSCMPKSPSSSPYSSHP